MTMLQAYGVRGQQRGFSHGVLQRTGPHSLRQYFAPSALISADLSIVVLAARKVFDSSLEGQSGRRERFT